MTTSGGSASSTNSSDAAALHDRVMDLVDRKAQLEVLLAEAESLAPLSHSILSGPLGDLSASVGHSAGEAVYSDFDHRQQAHQLCGRSLVPSDSGAFVTDLG